MKDKYMEILIADMERERQEIRAKIFGLIENAMKEDNWDTVRKYGY